MAYTFVPPLVKPKLKSVEVPISDTEQAAYDRIIKASRSKGLKEGAKTAKIEKEANAAIAETVKLWLTDIEGQDRDFVRYFFLHMSVLASASARNKIAKHSMFPSDLSDEIETHLEAMKEATAARQREEAEAKEKAKEDAAAAAGAEQV